MTERNKPNVRIACARGKGYNLSIWGGHGRRDSTVQPDYASLISHYVNGVPFGMDYDVVLTPHALARMKSETGVNGSSNVFHILKERDGALDRARRKEEKVKRVLNE